MILLSMIFSNLPGTHRDAATASTPPNPRLAPPFCADRAKICAVCGDDLRLGILFGQDNDRRVTGIHRGILEHQFLCAREIFWPRAQKLDGSIAHQTEQGVNGLGVASQIPTGFAKHNLACVDRTFDFFENGHTPPVPLVGGIEPTDQRQGQCPVM